MDPTSTSVRRPCDLCKTGEALMGCDTCLVNLCKACVGEHMMSGVSKLHKIVRFAPSKSQLYPFCASHIKKRYEMYCNECDVPACNACLRTDQHLGHEILQISLVLDEKKKKIIKEQTELKETISPMYQNIASDVQNKLSQLERDHADLSTAITKHGEDWHRKIEKVVKKLKNQVDEMKNKQLQTLQNHKDEISKTISEIKDEISSMERLINYMDITKLINATTNIEGYKNPPQITMPSLPKLALRKIKGEEFNKMFGGLSSNLSEEDGLDCVVKTEEILEDDASLPFKQFMEEPETITTLETDYHLLYNVACLSDDEIWTTGQDKTMKLYSISQRSLLKSIATKSEYRPEDITVTNNGDLVYVDLMDGTVNIVKNEKIRKLVRQKNWRPDGACNTVTGDLLVIMNNNDNERTQVLRYHGSTIKQSIEFDDEGKPIYSSGPAKRLITENRNLDICVSDQKARAVVVVNQAGKLRFRYTGRTPAPKNQPFSPQGITTNSQSHILTADYINDCVHIIDQDGQFLRFITFGISEPLGLCTDTNDNLIVAEYRRKQMKKIKYLM
ncbi:tripartite motif-containing protein 55-like [Saccostrea cucullata]|uniref:tripartite motif-containing protein 55-like n=1 Tax=Saccostrea cuccullata TaxID=36930 RepID=UPI002ED27B4C